MEKEPNENKVKIYKAARKLFSQYDFEDVTIRMICEKANVSIGTFYHYYPSKYSFMSIFNDHLDEFARTIKKKIDQGSYSATDKLVKFFVFQSDEISEGNNVKDTITLLQIQIKHPEADIYSHDRASYTYVMDMLRECQETGSLPESLSLEMLADFLFASFRGLVIDWWANDKSYSLSERMEIYTSAILRAFQTP